MVWSRRLWRTARLKCESCSHSSCVDLKIRDWLLWSLGNAMLGEIRLRAKCSNCGARNATLLQGTAGDGLFALGVRIFGAPKNGLKANVMAKD